MRVLQKNVYSIFVQTRCSGRSGERFRVVAAVTGYKTREEKLSPGYDDGRYATDVASVCGHSPPPPLFPRAISYYIYI